jgi:hypothetical protein
MPARNNDRARLGEQDGRSGESVESEEIVARPSQAENEEDLTAGDEGIDESEFESESESEEMRGTERESEDERSRSRSMGPNRSRPSSRPNQEDSRVGSESEFSGRGGQKGGSVREGQGTGYTNDRTGQLQEDDSLSGTQGRQGQSGSRQGSSPRKGSSGLSDSERVGGQTAQNPRKNASTDN